ncbi:hypothetical protein E2C00_11465 [Streptomyces sp. WAC05374]|uniref:hypothetical protein n=1 Tax=Streptomyces sp. WAC05374 TaxID=2487420 RepID=UPI000F88D549|nr:hypothetical protein [Streptomyces sp. WAC05374]RST17248.1 hypothetical protein EF905_10250 [Streptomyces sp. WAC05374]TDF47380.1 hypothetical protein E2B92_10290 [Streptomyces sp. WAC05374]TDF57638.1 hypothetical protein E2C00_11465 [Streptomyces sp. WAC05374]TDF61743.1 hypothetical protein E2C02_02665 [Streptomyces sp. WAC05374]
MHAHHQTPAVPGVGDHHNATTTERGSFAVARCTCGWAGPARRSRDRARLDAAAHMAAPPERP